MIYDCRQILWLKAHHARAALTRILYASGTDLTRDNEPSERIYQLYVLVIILIAIILSWLGFVDFISESIHVLDTAILNVFPKLFLVLCGVLLLTLSYQHIKYYPLKLSYPDIVYVASSPLSVTPLAQAAVFQSSLLCGICGLALGYFIGVILGANTSALPLFPLILALMSALAFMCSDIVASILGFIRLLFKRKSRKLYGIGLLLIELCIIGWVLLCIMNSKTAALTLAGFTEFIQTNQVVIFTLLFIVIIVGHITIALVVKRLSISEVIDENALYAELFPLRHLQMSNADSYRTLRRRKILSHRSPILNLPDGSGSRMLVQRAVLSQIRQYEGILSLIVYGALILPFGVYLLLSTFSLPGFILWATLLVLVPGGQKELVRVFRDDQHNRMMRTQLAFNTLALLWLDSIPAFLLTAILSVVAVLFLPLSVDTIWGIILAVLINTAIVICGGLDYVSLFDKDYRFSFELSLMVFIAVLAICTLFNSPLLIVACALCIIATYGALLQRGSE